MENHRLQVSTSNNQVMIASLRQLVKTTENEKVQREKVLQLEIDELKQKLANIRQIDGNALMDKQEKDNEGDECTELKALILKQTQIHEEALAEREQLINNLKETIMEAREFNTKIVEESEEKIKTMLEDHTQKVQAINNQLVKTQAENAQFQNQIKDLKKQVDTLADKNETMQDVEEL